MSIFQISYDPHPQKARVLVLQRTNGCTILSFPKNCGAGLTDFINNLSTGEIYHGSGFRLTYHPQVKTILLSLNIRSEEHDIQGSYHSEELSPEISADLIKYLKSFSS